MTDCFPRLSDLPTLAIALCLTLFSECSWGNEMSGIIWYRDFNSGDDILDMDFRYSGNTYSDIVTIGGERALRLHLDRDNDPVSYRTEIVPTNLPSSEFDGGTYAKVGGEYWYSFEIYIPTDWEYDANAQSIVQWHGLPDDGEPWRRAPLSLSIDPSGDGSTENYVLKQQADSRKIQPYASYEYVNQTNLGSIEDDKGQWVDWTVHVKWSYQNDGFLEVYKDGELVFEQTNQMNTFNDDLGPYWKLGIYKHKWSDGSDFGADTRTLYFDDITIGDASSTIDDFWDGGTGSSGTDPALEPQPTDSEPQTTDSEPQTTDSEPQTTDSEPQPTVSEPQPTVSEPQATNTAPLAQPDSFVSTEDQTLQGNVLQDNGGGADSDPEGDSLNVTAGVFSTASGGSVEIQSNGDFNYQPLENFNGSDSFEYELTDEHGANATGTVTVQVDAVNDAPIALTTQVQGSGEIVGTLQAEDPDGDALTFSLAPDSDSGTTTKNANAESLGQIIRGGRSRDDEDGRLLVLEVLASVKNADSSETGEVTIAADGTFTYTPPAGFTGTDEFEYVVTDENGASTTQLVTVQITQDDSLLLAQATSDSGSTLVTASSSTEEPELNTGGETSPWLRVEYQQALAPASQSNPEDAWDVSSLGIGSDDPWAGHLL
jgi:hypothetical protein